MFDVKKANNSILFFVDSKSNLWKYYDGSFWSTAPWKGKMSLLACPAMANGTPDIDGDEVNACDVSECEQHHLDFVNDSFNTNFELHGTTAENPIGEPSLG